MAANEKIIFQGMDENDHILYKVVKDEYPQQYFKWGIINKSLTKIYPHGAEKWHDIFINAEQNKYVYLDCSYYKVIDSDIINMAKNVILEHSVLKS